MDRHELHHATIKSDCATHLKDRNIKEKLHGEKYMKMVASLFDGTVDKEQASGK